MRATLALVVAAVLLNAYGQAAAGAAAPVELKVVGEWDVAVKAPVTLDGNSRVVEATLHVNRPKVEVVNDERYEALPMFDLKPHPFGWNRGMALVGLRAAGCTTRHALDPASVIVRAEPGIHAPAFARGKDYEMDEVCASLGRIAGSTIGEKQPVFVSYRYVKLRIDSVVLTKSGELVLREGEPHIATPLPPKLGDGETRLANLWLPGRPMKQLTADHLLPILETAYPEPPKPTPTVAERLLPKTLKKLQEGQPVKLVCWGDSVTECGWLPEQDRWPNQLVARLKERFPKAQIELIDHGWGGKNSQMFVDAPAGHAHNYREQILGRKPDLIVFEFINDSPLSAAQVEEKYSRFLSDFQQIGAEWVIQTGIYTSADGMGFTKERDIDADPRPYTKAVREFTARHDVALAEVALRWGRLWRQGLPYSTLLSNTINHPDPRGMKLIVDGVLELFP